MAQLIPDGQLSFEGGQDSSLAPSRLADNQFASGVNLSTSKALTHRFGYERKKLIFPSGGYVLRYNRIVNFKTLFESGKFQALAPYQIANSDYLIAVVSGVIFQINQRDFTVRVLTTNTLNQLSEIAPRINWAPAGRFIVFFDFPNRPIIVEGQTARRSSREAGELQASNLGTYNQNRLFFANYGNEFTAGDPVGNPLTPDAPITVFEITTEGSPFLADVYAMPSRYNNPITAMLTLQSADSSTGYGPMIVASNREIFTYDTLKPRDQWLVGQFGKSVSDNVGIIAARACTNVGSDVFFISGDGQLRSLSTAQDEQKKWSRFPMNEEVKNWVSYLSDDLKKYSTVCYFNNRIFWTVRPYRVVSRRLDGTPIHDVAHSGFLVLNTANVSRLGVSSPPSWEGLWTGVRPLDMCVNNERMFIMSKEYYSRNALYEVDPELKYDRSESGKRRLIKSTVYTKEHYFQDMFAIKSLKDIELGITDIQGMFKVKIDWKPSHSSNFLPWSEFDHNVPYEYCDLNCGDIPERMPLSFRELRFGAPDTEAGHPVTQDLYDRVKRVQYRITITADSWKLNEYKIQANLVQENSTEFLIEEELPEYTQYRDCYSDWDYEEFGL